MIVVGVVLIAMFLVGMYYFAVFALPAIVGIWVFFWAMNTGAGLGSAVAGIVAGVAVYLIGQLAFSFTRNLPIRLLLMAAFGVPAGLLAYNAMLQLSEAVIPSPVWRHVFAVPGGIIIGVIAVGRVISAPTPGYRPPMYAGHQRRTKPVILEDGASLSSPLRASIIEPGHLLPPAEG